MSSLATAGKRAAPGEPRATQSTGALRLRASTDAAVGLALAAALALDAFVTAGGVDLASNTWAEIVLTLIGVSLAIALLLWGAPGRPWGGTTLLLFAAVMGLTAASIGWSVQGDNSWLEANRTFSYLAAFGGAIALARLVPERWPALVGSIALVASVISAYALLVKVFPETFDPSDLIGRLHAPFDYWNATGVVAALGLPACLWAGSRRGRGPVVRALCVPAIALLVTVVVLSYSRSALLAAILGIGCWFALVPVRLRAALVLGLGLAGGAAVTIWALGKHPLTHDGVALAARTNAGHSFGLVLVLALVVLTAVGLAASFVMDRVSLPPSARRRIGTALVTLVALVPVGGVVALAASSRGLTGEVSHVWHTLTSSNNGWVGDNPGRLVQLSNSRPRYWNEGLMVGEHALLKGVGAAGYGIARTRYTRDPYIVAHAHSYIVETFADFGLIGIALNLALLVAWARACARTLGVRIPVRLRRSAVPDAPPAGDRPEHTEERAGLLTLLCIVLVFGVQSAIDWTWFVPGAALPALVCAGWLAGRGPLAKPVGRLTRRRRLSRCPAVSVAAATLTAVAILAAWAIWQPLRSANADSAAIAAFSRGDTESALADARAAAARDPLSIEPHWELSAILSATGNQLGAYTELAKAIALQPENAATWQQLGFYDLRLRQPRGALASFEEAY
ncbi:MAG: O-antigen ligase family protein, partial [Actinomycetota bacterium]|nr:O-antigen ligase family protein [Actinomycetota bacterium]